MSGSERPIGSTNGMLGPDWRQTLIVVSALFGAFGAVALVAWIVPVLRPSYVLDGWSWVVVSLAPAFLTTTIYILFTSGVLQESNVRAFARIVKFAGYFLAGAIGLAWLGVVPPTPLWVPPDESVLVFFVFYAAVISALRLWAPTLISALRYVFDNPPRITPAVWIWAYCWRFLKAAILIAAPAVAMAAWGLAPPLTTWVSLNHITTTAPFFLLYSALLLALSLAAERLLRPLPTTTPAVKLYGVDQANLINKGKLLSFIAQVACFVTAMNGVALVLVDSYPSSANEGVAISVPRSLASALGLETDLTLHITWLRVLSICIALFLALFTWYWSVVAINQLLALKRVPGIIQIEILLFGLVATYCGFLMWNGRIASAEELREGIEDTKFMVRDSANYDQRNLAPAGELVSQVREFFVREKIQQDIAILIAESRATTEAMNKERINFQRLIDALLPLTDKGSTYSQLADCEASRGCVSNMPGNSAVWTNLLALAGLYDGVNKTLTTEKDVHTSLMNGLDNDIDNLRTVSTELPTFLSKGPLSDDDLAKLESKAVTLRATVSKIKETLSRAFALDPVPSVDSLISKLRNPLQPADSKNVEGRKRQADRIYDREKILQGEAQDLENVTHTYSYDRPSLVNRNEDSEANKIANQFSALAATVQKLEYDRNADRTVVMTNLAALEQQIDDDLNSQDKLVLERSHFVSELNANRDIVRFLELVDVNNLRLNLHRIGYSDAELTQTFAALRSPDEMAGRSATGLVPPYKLTTLGVEVIKYYYLSLVPLLLQAVIDFGFALALIFGASAVLRPSEHLAPQLAEA